jgi:hypothetical protein
MTMHPKCRWYIPYLPSLRIRALSPSRLFQLMDVADALLFESYRPNWPTGHML